MRITLAGDKEKAGLWIGFAKAKLRQLVESMSPEDTSASRRFSFSGISIVIGVSEDGEHIRIAAEAGLSFIVCHVGDSTSGADYIKKYYDIGTLKEIAKPAGWTLVDDGTYGVDFDTGGVVWFAEDPDDYTYYLDGGGIGVAESVLAIDAKNTTQGTSRRFMMNQAGEAEAWHSLIDVGGIFKYLIPSYPITTRHYGIIPRNPYVCRYTPDGILTINDTVEEPIGFVITLNSIEYLNYLDRLPFSSRAFLHYLDTTIPKKSAVLPGATYDDGSVVHDGSGLVAAVQHYSDRRVTQDIIRADQFDFAPSVPFDEPLTASTVNLETGASSDQGEYHRGAGDDKNKYLQDGYWNADRTVDAPTQLVTDFGWSAVKDDVLLYAGVKEGGEFTGVRVQKVTDGTSVRTALVVAGIEIDSNEYEAPVWLHPDDFYAGPQVVGDLGKTPIVAFRTHYKILHVHHGAKFDAVVYVKTEYQATSESFTGHKTAWAGSPLFGGANGRIRENMVYSKNTYFACVNGVVYDLGHSFYQVERQLTIAPEVPDVGDVAVVTIYDDAVCDAGYDMTGADLTDQEQVSRVFTSENDRLLLVFDVYPVSWKHEILQSGLSLGYNVIPASTPAVPPTIDSAYATPSQRRLLLFTQDGELRRDGDFPEKTAGVMWNRLNGISLMESN